MEVELGRIDEPGIDAGVQVVRGGVLGARDVGPVAVDVVLQQRAGPVAAGLQARRAEHRGVQRIVAGDVVRAVRIEIERQPHVVHQVVINRVIGRIVVDVDAERRACRRRQGVVDAVVGDAGARVAAC